MEAVVKKKIFIKTTSQKIPRGISNHFRWCSITNISDNFERDNTYLHMKHRDLKKKSNHINLSHIQIHAYSLSGLLIFQLKINSCLKPTPNLISLSSYLFSKIRLFLWLKNLKFLEDRLRKSFHAGRKLGDDITLLKDAGQLWKKENIVERVPVTSSLWRRDQRKQILKRVFAQLCPTLCDPMNCSPPGSSIHGILQARILEGVAISFSRGFSRPRDGTRVSRIVGRFFTNWATREVIL